MPRDFARWNVSASTDDDWRALPFAAQWLYKTLWDHPRLSYCGVLDWRPGRLAAAASGLDSDAVRALAACLESRLFVVIDEETEEILVRSWARFDGLMRQPRMAVSFAKAYATVESATVRGVLVHEARKIRTREPDLAGWGKPAVAELLERPAVDPRSRALPEDPLGPDLGPVSVPFGANGTSGLGPVWVAPTPTPTPTPSPTPRRSDADASTRSSAPRESDPEGFAEFWTEYPKKVDKGHARKAYASALKKATPDVVRAGATAYAAHVVIEKTERGYIANPGTWLNGERWTDDYTPTTPTRPEPPSPWGRTYKEAPPDA